MVVYSTMLVLGLSSSLMNVYRQDSLSYKAVSYGSRMETLGEPRLLTARKHRSRHYLPSPVSR